MRIKGILLLVLLVSILIIILPSEATVSNEQTGNSYGNIVNYGLIAQSGDYYYFSNGYDGWKLYAIKKDDTLKRKITDDSCQYINVSDNKIFYTNTSDGWKIYSVNTDGTDRKKLNDEHSEYVSVAGEYVVYVDVSNSWKITRINKDGTDKTTISQDAATSINVTSEWIYYINWSDNKKIYRIRTDGTGRQKITNDSASQINLHGDRIYYINESGKNEIYYTYINSSGGYGTTRLFDDSAVKINLSDNWLYYVNEEGSLYKIDLQETPKSRTLVREAPSYVINAVEKWIVFCAYYEENFSLIYYDEFLRVTKDGKILQGEAEMYDSEKSAEVSAIIAALPLPSELKAADIPAVEDARAAYDALTEAQKAMVTNYNVLTAAEAKVQDLIPKEIKSGSLKIDKQQNLISNIQPETSIDSVLNQIDPGIGRVEVYDNKGQKVTTGNIGTGYKIKLFYKDQLVDEKSVVIYGDVNGDGKITATDMLAVELHIFGRMNLEGAFFEAASLAKKDKLTATDMLIIELHIFKKSLIKQDQ